MEKEEMGKGGAKEGSVMNSFERFHNLLPICQVCFLHPSSLPLVCSVASGKVLYPTLSLTCFHL